MKLFLIPLLLAALPGAAMGGIMKKKSGRDYSHLWNNSPFTEPKKEQPKPIHDPFEHYALTGVAPIPGGYRVTLLDRRHPDTRIILPDQSEFKIINVRYSPGKPLNTTVRLSLEGQEGLVAFDQKFLTPVSAPTNTAGSPAAGKPNEIPPRQPRPRTTNPPTTGAGGPQ